MASLLVVGIIYGLFNFSELCEGTGKAELPLKIFIWGIALFMLYHLVPNMWATGMIQARND